MNVLSFWGDIFILGFVIGAYVTSIQIGQKGRLTKLRASVVCKTMY